MQATCTASTHLQKHDWQQRQQQDMKRSSTDMVLCSADARKKYSRYTPAIDKQQQQQRQKQTKKRNEAAFRDIC
jgi:hypothetical protein